MPLKPEMLKGWGPGGWQFFQPETNWHAPNPLANTFDQQCDNIIAMRKANPRFNLPTDKATVAAELEAYTDARLRKIYSAHGMQKFLAPGSIEVKKNESNSTGNALRLLNAAAERVGVDLAPLEDWLGAGGIPVAKELAESRAAVCKGCVANQKTGFWALLTVNAGKKIRAYLGRKADLNLATTQDAELGLCRVCKCSLELKVWCPIEHIKANQSGEEHEQLRRANLQCWAANEQ